MPRRVGTLTNDTINGDWNPSDLQDALYGLAGNDILQGGVDDDILDGGLGQDTLDGGPGTDTLYGYDGNDVILGGDGNDHLLGLRGHDTVDGGEGDDFLVDGLGGNDILNGGAGNDEIYIIHHPLSLATRETNIVDGGEGIDTITFGYVYRLYTVTNSGDQWTVVFNLTGRESTYLLTNVERIAFPYRTIDTTTGAAIVARGNAMTRTLKDTAATRPLAEGLLAHASADRRSGTTDLAGWLAAV